MKLSGLTKMVKRQLERSHTAINIVIGGQTT